MPYFHNCFNKRYYHYSVPDSNAFQYTHINKHDTKSIERAAVSNKKHCIRLIVFNEFL